MHMFIRKLTIIGSDNGLSPGQRQPIIWTNAGILLIRTWGTNLSEILIKIHTFSFKKMHLKMLSGKVAANLSRPQCVKWFHKSSIYMYIHWGLCTTSVKLMHLYFVKLYLCITNICRLLFIAIYVRCSVNLFELDILWLILQSLLH